ncbi:MAG: serine hydrolase, partial [Verrucomicrobia bacterium]|nr:serine hydrolase [Verrucomicrobiota bacterium]
MKPTVAPLFSKRTAPQLFGLALITVTLALLLECAPGTIRGSANAQSSEPASGAGTFPGKNWSKAGRPEELGWSSEKLAAARQQAGAIGSAAVFIVHRGQVVSEWGETAKHFNVHSIRKSFLSALYGVPGLAEKFDLNATMEQLGIDDNEPRLTAVEKQATVRDLLKARSGVYHPALYETDAMKKRRPARGSHAPGTFWYYNNWDFNALGTIFEQRTGVGVFEAFQRHLAQPLGMEDFRMEDTEYVRGADSIHPAYPFRMTARDMARFGLLFARGGQWNGKQIIPAKWVAESTTSWSPATSESGEVRCGYGYLWWTELNGLQLEGVDLPRGSYSARGAGGHYILVVPAWDLVVVHRVDTDKKDGPRVTGGQFGKLVKLIVEAMPEPAKKKLATADAQSLPLPQSLDELVPALMAKHKVPGVAIVGIADRRIAWERQYGVRAAGQPETVRNDTLFEAASMSKPLAAYAALKLVEQGRLDLDRPLREYLDRPYLTNEPLHLKITARMVLSHTTGFPNWREGGWRAGGPLPVKSEPGTKFTYSGEGFLYLQRVLEHLTGELFEKYIQRTLLAPVGIQTGGYVWRDAFAPLAAAGHNDKGEVPPSRELFRQANTAYSLYCSPMEYALFLVELLRLDRSAPHSLSAKSLEAMFTRTTKTAERSSVVRRGGPRDEPSYYGLGWAMDATASGDRLRHSGSNGTGFRCYCEFDPKRGTGIVIMTNGAGGD